MEEAFHEGEETRKEIDNDEKMEEQEDDEIEEVDIRRTVKKMKMKDSRNRWDSMEVWKYAGEAL